MLQYWFSRCLLSIVIFALSSTAFGETHVGGVVEGIWTSQGSPYIVDSTLIIEAGKSLVIQDSLSIEILFFNPDSIIVFGTLIAQGVRDDSVFFWDADKYNWRGIWFMPGSTNCLLDFVSLQKPQWGVHAEYSQPLIRNSSIRAHSSAVWAINADNITLLNSTLTADALQSEVVRLRYSDAIMREDSIQACNEFADDVVGIKIYKSDPQIWDCTIEVIADGIARGMWIEETDKSVIFYNLIHVYSKNIAYGAFMLNGSPSFVNNTVIVESDLSYSAKNLLLQVNSYPLIQNCILYGNGTSDGVVALSGSDPIVVYNDFFNHINNTSGCSTGIGCIIADPAFVDLLNDDYRLTRHSPCIDAGNPYSPMDPDGTYADMGCYYFDGTTGIEYLPPTGSPSDFALLEVFPNPFNSQSHIALSLPQEMIGTLAIFDQQGRLVETLKSGNFTAGENYFSWEASAASSGIYWISFRSQTGTTARSVFLLK